MEIISEYLLLSKEGNEVVLHYAEDDKLGYSYVLKNEDEAERFCTLCRQLAAFIEESGQEAVTERKVAAYQELLEELMQDKSLQTV